MTNTKETVLKLIKIVVFILSARMLADILEPKDTGEVKKEFTYLTHRVRLWWLNLWKLK